MMFGHPAYYVGGRLFACIMGDGVGIKVPAALAAQLVAGGTAIPFQPYGKPPMREWIFLRHRAVEEYRSDETILRQSAAFVYDLAFIEGRGA